MDDVVVHGVNESGAYIGLVPIGVPFKEVLSPPPTDGVWMWDFNECTWIRKHSLQEVKTAAAISIDNKAGFVRSKFITDVPGQAATYLLKADQATKFKDRDYTGSVPGLVQSEATARNISARDAADVILAEQDLWISIATAIETVRRGCKEQLKIAQSENDVNQILSASLSQLDLIYGG